MALRNMLRLAAVEKATGHKKSQIYKLMADGEFPRPYQTSPQCVAWDELEILEWQRKLDRSTGGWCPRDRKQQSTSETV
jgi:prophage regulatory protein